ncbi:MAG: hypothetical protein WCK77_22220 [Verrucomicrobiota bacterium]
MFGVLLLLSLVVFAIGRLGSRRWLSRGAAAVAAMILLTWGLLLVTRPAWLRIALQPVVPIPTTSALVWESRSPGLETAELELRAEDVVVDHNFDGGPLVSQVVSAGQFYRTFHGRAEISDGADVLRAFWHEHFRSSWTLPIVLVAVPISP